MQKENRYMRNISNILKKMQIPELSRNGSDQSKQSQEESASTYGNGM
jgi:hypothetical protein